jgi:acyl carrier protein
VNVPSPESKRAGQRGGSDQDRLRDFVATNYYVPEKTKLDDLTSFLTTGILDSTGVLELVAFVEKEFGVPITDEDLVPANFDSIANVVAFIARKRG